MVCSLVGGKSRGTSAEGEDLCPIGVSYQEFDKSDFDGEKYVESQGADLKLKTFTIPQGGNRKNVSIVDPDTGAIIWKQKLYEELHLNYWGRPPTEILTLNMNFINISTGVVMEVIVVAWQSSTGIFALEIDTNRF